MTAQMAGRWLHAAVQMVREYRGLALFARSFTRSNPTYVAHVEGDSIGSAMRIAFELPAPFAVLAMRTALGDVVTVRHCGEVLRWEPVSVFDVAASHRDRCLALARGDTREQAQARHVEKARRVDALTRAARLLRPLARSPEVMARRVWRLPTGLN